MIRFDRAKVLRLAQSYFGLKFAKQGRGEETDCIGLLIRFYGEFGFQLPDFSDAPDWESYVERYVSLISVWLKKIDKKELVVGDLILFQTATGRIYHAGIFLGEGRFLHATVHMGGMVRIDATYNSPWKERIYGYFRLDRKDAGAPAD